MQMRNTKSQELKLNELNTNNEFRSYVLRTVRRRVMSSQIIYIDMRMCMQHGSRQGAAHNIIYRRVTHGVIFCGIRRNASFGGLWYER